MPYHETQAAMPGTVHAAKSAYCPPRQKPVMPTRRPAVSGRAATYATALATSPRMRASGGAAIVLGEAADVGDEDETRARRGRGRPRGVAADRVALAGEGDVGGGGRDRGHGPSQKPRSRRQSSGLSLRASRAGTSRASRTPR